MEPQTSALHDDFDEPPIAVGEVDETSDDVAFGSGFQLKRLAEI
jgi:hypothetical protein